MAEDGLRSIQFNSELAQSCGDELRHAIQTFEPLPFDAGEGSAAWLRSCLQTANVPVQTELIVREDDPSRLLGFYALRPLAFNTLATDDQAILDVTLLSADEPRHGNPQPGTLIELIARSTGTERGFGEHLLTYAIARAIDNDTVAVLIEPDNEKTRAHFRERYYFREFDEPADPGVVRMLWHPVHHAVANWPS